MKRTVRNKPLRPPTVKTAAMYAAYINILIYLLFFVMFIYGRNAVLPSDPEHATPPPPTTLMMIIGILSTYLYVFFLFIINFRISRGERLLGPAKTVVAVAVSLVFIILWNKLMFLIQDALFDFPEMDIRAVRGGMMRDLVLGGIAIFSSQLLYVSYRRQQISLENEALRAEYERARYETLKNQIDPHFLFNTLNTLTSVISHSPKKAQEYVRKLSSIFRYTIQGREASTLSEELGFTKDYCELMQIRYGDNLHFEFSISERYNSYNIVPFSIQTLVENAIKHNVISDRQPLTVSITTGDDDSVTVSNTISPKKESTRGEGVGLANLTERYLLKWGEEITISNDGGIFSVRLPLIPPMGQNNSIS